MSRGQWSRTQLCREKLLRQNQCSKGSSVRTQARGQAVKPSYISGMEPKPKGEWSSFKEKEEAGGKGVLPEPPEAARY